MFRYKFDGNKCFMGERFEQILTIFTQLLTTSLLNIKIENYIVYVIENNILVCFLFIEPK